MHFNNYPSIMLRKVLLCSNHYRQLWGRNKIYKHSLIIYRNVNDIRKAPFPLSKQIELPQTTNLPEGDLKHLEKEFPDPRGALTNFMTVVANELKTPSHKLNVSFRSDVKKSSWICNCHVSWPAPTSFSATAKTKRDASKLASLKALQWLMHQGKIKNKKPILIDQATKKALNRVDINIILNDENISQLEDIISVYDQEVKSIIDKSLEEDGIESSLEEVPIQLTTNWQNDSTRLRSIKSRNQLLQQRESNSKDSDISVGRQKLPIYNFRDNILNAIDQSQVVVIKGEPGCGKSTQVPQYIFEKAAIDGQACDCNIIVTQPRRISAITLAERVAWEREEQVGDVIGYQVRFRTKNPRPPGGSIRFCSSGILLRLLQSNPTLEGVSHVILDEAHERDVNTDMLMLLLKRVLKVRPDIKLLVMSATINPELFQQYYSGAEALMIPGFTYPVKSYFLDEIAEVSLKETRKSLDSMSPRLVYDEIANVIQWIDSTKGPGSILCFLPGWQDIKSVQYHLKNVLNSSTTLILPLHSRLTFDEQARVFKAVPKGIRKIILSTNVAETSVTIDDVAFVVDTGIHKEERLTADKMMSILDNEWISKANVNQRKGRGGRVRAGECFHLYTAEKYDNLQQFPVPELHRIPLQKVVLDIKTYNNKEKVAEFLLEMPEPPSAEASINAVRDLEILGALTPDENLTALGRRIAKFSTHPKLSKVLVYASIYKCLDSVLTITSILSADADMFSNSLEERSEIVSIKRAYHNYSDHLATLQIYNKWKALYDNRDEGGEEMFCKRNMLRPNTMRLISRIKKLSEEQLTEAKLIQEKFPWDDDNVIDEVEALPVSQNFVSSVLFSGLSTYLFRRNWDVKSGRIQLNKPSLITENGTKAHLASDSVCHKKSNLPSPILTYFRRQESAVRRASVIRDAGVITPLAVALFSSESNILESKESHRRQSSSSSATNYRGKTPFRIKANERDMELLKNLRVILNDVTQYFLQNEGVLSRTGEYQTVSNFRDVLVMTLSDILNNSNYKTSCVEVVSK